jgi:hypothetical protein
LVDVDLIDRGDRAHQLQVRWLADRERCGRPSRQVSTGDIVARRASWRVNRPKRSP